MNALTGGNHQPAHEPFALFRHWMDEAEAREINDPNAMCLATVDANGLPNARMVLLKGFDDDGFVFYTNAESAKGRELAAQPKAAGVLHWKSLRRQFRFRGPVEQCRRSRIRRLFRQPSRATAASAPGPASNRGRWKAVSRWKRRSRSTPRKFNFGDGAAPAYWGGYRIRPVEIEFWTDKPFRLHERLRLPVREPEGTGFARRLYP